MCLSCPYEISVIAVARDEMKFGGFEKCATGDRSSQFSVKEQVKMSESEVLAASYGRFLFSAWNVNADARG